MGNTGKPKNILVSLKLCTNTRKKTTVYSEKKNS